ncbi:putative MFS monocarboxylate transporter [Talaromyces proteolyticus]|uniref:MFS monocarboxylate transporter n=1 Tax=Talaromyces proteolyticus TaxID=1131652 RepID=A0AAD4PVK8_9EURO|nr:putative MFS monocarboxylate transporter [Talaromyces proteolyticus]KAH8690475.1 putative MFS monocarboxylate transporter [Talaromyces proteolyticus]
MSDSTSEGRIPSFEIVKASDDITETGIPKAEGQVGKEETAQPAPAGPPPPPNGGIKAWLQVLGGFLFVLNTWGLANSYGIFQTYYSSTLLVTSSQSSLSWIGSIQGFLLLFIGVFCGRAFDGGYFYPVVSLGIFLEVFGMMMTSLATKYYQVFLAQGLCVGLGSGCLFTPAISLVGTYFSTRRALATGIAASGSSVGGVIFPIVIRRLIVTVGFPWAVRTMAFIMLATLGIGIALLRPRLPPRKSGPIIDLAAFKDPAYTTFVIGLALGFMAFFIPFFYAESYALNIGADTNISFYVLSIMNGAGMIGRLLPNAMADKVGSLNVIVPCAYLSGIIVLSWISVQHLGNLIATSVLYSFFSGGLMALPPAVLVALSPNLAQIGVRVGMALTVGSLGVLIGSPIAGAILSSQSQNNDPDVQGALDYTGTLAFTGVTLLVCGVLMTGTRVIKKGFGLETV